MKQLKNLFLILALSVSLVTGLPSQVVKDQAPVLDDQSAPFAYEVKAEIPTPADKLAAFVSSDYRNASTEFEKHDLLEQIKPVIEKRIEAAKDTKTFVIKINYTLSPYDFERHGFDTGINESTFVPFQNYYAAKFSNWDQIGFVPVEEAKARTLDASLRNGRSGILRIYCTIEGSKEEQLNYNNDKVIYVRATRVVISLGNSKKLVGEKVLNVSS